MSQVSEYVVAWMINVVANLVSSPGDTLGIVIFVVGYMWSLNRNLDRL